ncbi:MAG TPA: histidine kinase, partial [Actinomycetota bacterium]|nr:histidine kinase [Actinomycetota bacterium]
MSTSSSFSSRSLLSAAIVWLGLAAYTVAVYLLLVVAVAEVFGAERLTRVFLPMVATAVVALTLRRVGDWLRAVASRIVYGHRQPPADSLAEFSRRVSRSFSVETMLPEIVRILAEGTGAEATQLWVRIGDELVLTECWPGGSAEARLHLEGEQLPSIEGADLSTPVTEGGELLGALALYKKEGAAVTGIERRLTEDLASQAAIVLRNVRTTAELEKSVEQISALTVQLRESRRQVVEVQDAERRRIERTLHDEAQQYLMALVIQLDRALIVLKKSPERIAESLPKLRVLQEQVAGVLTGFSSGLSPADLAERGLADTLRSHIERLSLPVVIDDGGIGRYAPQVEEAVYYTALEAVQNAVKHSGASEIRLSLSGDGRGLE